MSLTELGPQALNPFWHHPHVECCICL